MFTTLLCVYTLVAYGLGYTVWLNHWVIGFVLLSLPMAMIGCLVVGIWLLFRKPKRAVLPLVVLLMGYPFMRRTYAWHSDEAARRSFRVLSYNAMFFDIDAVSEHRHSEANAVAMMKWINAFDADIKCFQEFYNWEGQKRFKEFNTKDQLTRQGFTYQLFAQPNSVKKEGAGFVGLAIFSKYPLIFRREFVFSPVGNGCLVADVIIRQDTFRLLNIHLQSMGIRVGRLFRQSDYEQAKRETKGIFNLLKNGFEKRGKEIQQVEKIVEDSPYPVLVCGDFNEVPYGYAYGRIRKHLSNAFEEAGQGFGFSYNRSPKLIRIDNQFYDDRKLSVHHFITHQVTYSDHYPVSAMYVIKK